MDKRLLDSLCCPVSKAPLALLSRSQLDALNASIRNGSVQTVSGDPVGTPLAAGLLTTDGNVIYRIEDDIPVMLADEAIGTTQLSGFPR